MAADLALKRSYTKALTSALGLSERRQQRAGRLLHPAHEAWHAAFIGLEEIQAAKSRREEEQSRAEEAASQKEKDQREREAKKQADAPAAMERRVAAEKARAL